MGTLLSAAIPAQSRLIPSTTTVACQTRTFLRSLPRTTFVASAPRLPELPHRHGGVRMPISRHRRRSHRRQERHAMLSIRGHLRSSSAATCHECVTVPCDKVGAKLAGRCRCRCTRATGAFEREGLTALLCSHHWMHQPSRRPPKPQPPRHPLPLPPPVPRRPCDERWGHLLVLQSRCPFRPPSWWQGHALRRRLSSLRSDHAWCDGAGAIVSYGIGLSE